MRKLHSWIERHVYYYHCTHCGKRKWTFKKAVQRLALCREGRRNPENSGQINMFSDAYPGEYYG